MFHLSISYPSLVLRINKMILLQPYVTKVIVQCPLNHILYLGRIIENSCILMY